MTNDFWGGISPLDSEGYPTWGVPSLDTARRAGNTTQTKGYVSDALKRFDAAKLEGSLPSCERGNFVPFDKVCRERDILSKIWYDKWLERYPLGDGPGLLGYVARGFKEYLDSIRGRRVYVLGYITEGEHAGKVTGFENFCRFQPEYKSELDSKFGPMYRAVRGDGVIDLDGRSVDLRKSVMLTLTYDPKKHSLWESWDLSGQHLNSFMTYLKKVMGRQLDYVWVREAQPDTGYCHIHVLVFGIDYLMWNGRWDDYKKVSCRNNGDKTLLSMWKHGLTHVNKTEDGKVVRPMSYMLKYVRSVWGSGIEEGTSDKVAKGNLTRSLLWFFRKRCYGVSRDLNRWMDENRVLVDTEGDSYPARSVKWVGLLRTYGADRPMEWEELTRFMPKGWRDGGKDPPHIGSCR